MKKRILSLVLCLVLGLSLVPTGVLAADTPNWIEVSGIVGGRINFDKSRGIILDCEGTVTSADIPSTINGVTVTSIGSGAFYYCCSLTSITIPDSVTSIGGGAFSFCESLTNVTIPGNVTSIGDTAFQKCIHLTSVTIPTSVSSIGDWAFADCSSLTSVKIPNGVSSIGDYTFYCCSNLTNVTIPDSVSSIGDWAFANCSSLTNITLPKSLTSIGDSAFSNCCGLTSVTLPKSLTSIGDSAFSNCYGLTSITLPYGVTSIGWSAFSGCCNLLSITIPDSVSSLGRYAFSYCDSLTDVYYTGTEEEFYDLTQIPGFGASSDTLTRATLHFNSTGPEDEGEDKDEEFTTHTEYHQLKGHDAFTNTVIFEDDISYKWAHEDDWADIMALVGKWVRCTIEHSEQSGDVLIAVNETDDYFIVGRDSNWFFHNLSDFGYVDDRTECQSYGEDSIGKVYPTSINYYVKLINGLSWKEEISLLDYMCSGKWSGSCQGISLSMALANIGKISSSDFNNEDETYSCYYKLWAPNTYISQWNDYRLRDYITYCTLLQKTDQMPSSGKLTNSEKFGPVGSLANFITWGGFWDSFYDDVKTATENQIPLLFGFGWNASGTSHGHTILTCGYDDSNSDDRIVKLYDCNSPNQYLYLHISRKEQSFSLHYEDGSIPPYVSNENWNYFTYWDMNALQQVDAPVVTNSAKSSKTLTLLADKQTGDTNRTIFAVDAFQNFYLENSDGLYFSYDGNQYLGNMPIYDLKIIGEETQTFEFIIDSSPEFKITNFSDGCTFALFMGDEYNTASAKGADCIRFIENDGIYFDGQAYTFSAGLSSKETESLLRASGSCTGNSSITYSDTGTEMNTDGEYSSVQTQVINKTGAQSKESNETFSSAKVDANGNVSPEIRSGSSDLNSDSCPVTYTVTAPSSIANGSVAVNPKSAAKGRTVTITVKPDDGYVLDALTVTDASGKAISLTDQGSGTYTFTMPASKVSVAASFIALDAPTSDLPFTDVTASDWFYDAVAYVYNNGLMTGTSDTTFSPKATTTRGMIVTILHRLEGCPAADSAGFADVDSGAWYQAAVDWAAANGIVNGTSETTFAPNAPITREQLAAILYRYAAYKGYDVSQKADLSRFSDSSAVSAYAVDAMAWANAAGLITGITDTVLSPQGSAVRAQVSTILMRFCENIAQ